MEDNTTDQDDTYCNISISKELKPILVLASTNGSVCAFLCALAIAAMVFFRLFTLLTHRLILYMLVAILSFSLSVAVEFVGLWLDYWEEERFIDGCITEGFVMMYLAWVMLLSTLMVTLHLTGMVLLPSYYRSLSKMEPFYLLFPWICPLFVVWIPFLHNNYGISGSWCWIRLFNKDCSHDKMGAIEVYALWYGELIFGLALNNIALVIIALTLCKRAYRNTTSLDYRKALKQTLPLVAYPITYQLLSFFAILNRMYQVAHNGHSLKWMFYAHAATAPWGFFAPLFTFVYLLSLHRIIRENLRKWHCLRCCFGKKKKKRVVIIEEKRDKETSQLLDPADHLTNYGITVSSPTTANFRSEGEVEEEYETDEHNTHVCIASVNYR